MIARMLGVARRPWCPYCRTMAGPDCTSTARTRKVARQRERRAWRREDEMGD